MKLKTKVKQNLPILLDQYNNETSLVKYNLANIQQAYVLSKIGLESDYTLSYINNLSLHITEISKYDQIAIISFMTEYSLNPLANNLIQAIKIGNPILIDNALYAIRDFMTHQ